MYHIIYKVTNLVNGKVYFGRHSTENLDDGYLGSGKLIRRALEKYGKKNFRRDILEFCDSASNLVERERVVVCEELIRDPNTYNIVVGGQNPVLYGETNPFYGKVRTEKHKDSMLAGYKKFISSDAGRCMLEENKKRLLHCIEMYGGFSGRKHTNEAKAKISKRNSEILVGERNGSYGTFWITNGYESKKCRGDVPIGWYKGRVIRNFAPVPQRSSKP